MPEGRGSKTKRINENIHKFFYRVSQAKLGKGCIAGYADACVPQPVVRVGCFPLSFYSRPARSAWVYNNANSSASDCAANCANNCANNVRNNADFRRGVFGSAGSFGHKTNGHGFANLWDKVRHWTESLATNAGPLL